MSTKTLGWLVGARDGKKLGSGWDPVNFIPTLSQPGPFQSFADVMFSGQRFAILAMFCIYIAQVFQVLVASLT